MIKYEHLRQVSIIVFLMLVLLSACASNSGGTSTGNSSPTSQDYSSPSWWNGKDCDKGHYSAAYDLLGYDSNGNPKTWRGIEACGPLPGLNSTGPLEDFHGHGYSQYEFQCTELIARYELAANGLDSPLANGAQIVDAYTNTNTHPNTPLHKVVNNGHTQLFPAQGDVLSYEATSANGFFGHTSLVIASSMTSPGNGTITVLQQNMSWNGAPVPTDPLTVSSWVIQPSTQGAGSVISWMTTRPIPSPTQRTLTSQQTQSQTVNATGQRTTSGTQAKGMLRFREPYVNTGPFTFNAGTVFNDDPGNSPNIQMMIDATITVPADHTSVYVPAHVVQIGTIGNIPIGGWTHYLNHNDAEPVDISNSTPFTGGINPQTYTVVQQSDIDTAANALKASATQSAVADLTSQLRPNEHLVGDPQCTYNTTSDHAAGEKATTVTVTVRATCTATAST